MRLQMQVQMQMQLRKDFAEDAVGILGQCKKEGKSLLARSMVLLRPSGTMVRGILLQRHPTATASLRLYCSISSADGEPCFFSLKESMVMLKHARSTI